MTSERSHDQEMDSHSSADELDNLSPARRLVFTTLAIALTQNPHTSCLTPPDRFLHVRTQVTHMA